MKSLKPHRTPLYKSIDKVLWEEWDPIGVNDAIQARGEYSSYVPDVYKLKIKNAGKNEIADYLDAVVVEMMGMMKDRELSLKIAERILEL